MGENVSQPWAGMGRTFGATRDGMIDLLHQIWPTAQWILLIRAACAAMLSFIVLLVLAYSDRAIQRLVDTPLPTVDPLPSISLIAAAKDEARNIEQAVRSLVAIDYPGLQITLVNDRSTDK